MTARSNRNYGVDIARICAMGAVVLGHMVTDGGMLSAAHEGSMEWHVLLFLDSLTVGCVDLFAMITGYVGLGARHRYSSLARLWMQVMFTSAVITFAFSIYDGTFTLYRHFFFPVCGGAYWYFTAYFPLFFLMPILDRGILAMTKVQAIVIGGMIVFLLPFSDFLSLGGHFQLSRGYSFAWLTMLYILGGLLARFKPSMKVRTCFVLSGVFVACVWGSQIFAHLIFLPRNPFRSYVSTPVVLAVGFFLLGCSMLHVRCENAKRLITYVNPALFGVYLIHVHPLIYYRIWHGAFSNVNILQGGGGRFCVFSRR